MTVRSVVDDAEPPGPGIVIGGTAAECFLKDMTVYCQNIILEYMTVSGICPQSFQAGNYHQGADFFLRGVFRIKMFPAEIKITHERDRRRLFAAGKTACGVVSAIFLGSGKCVPCVGGQRIGCESASRVGASPPAGFIRRRRTVIAFNEPSGYWNRSGRQIGIEL